MFGVSGAPRKWVNNLINAIKGDGWTNETIKGNATSIASLTNQIIIPSVDDIPLTWVQGYYSYLTGAIVDTGSTVPKRIRATDYILADKKIILKIADGYRVAVRRYKKDNTFSSDLGWITGFYTIWDDGYKYSLSLGTVDDAVITPTAAENITVQYVVEKHQSMHAQVPTLTIRCAKEMTFSDGTPPKIEWYLLQDVKTNKFYISRDMKTKQYAFTFEAPHPAMEYMFGVAQNGDIVAVYRTETIADEVWTGSDDVRENPYVYLAYESYAVQHEIDFGASLKPSGWLENTGFRVLPNGTILFCEYTRPAVYSANIWRVSGDITNPSSWTAVKQFVIDEHLEHCHCIQYDQYTGVVYMSTGDDDIGSQLWHSLDAGLTWTQTRAASEIYCRALNYVFLEDYIYWGSDSYDRYVFKIERDENGVMDFTTVEQLANLGVSTHRRAIYGLAYIEVINAILLCERADWQSETELDIHILDLEDDTVKTIGKLYSVVSTYGSYLGFRCEFVDFRPDGDTIHFGFGTWYDKGDYHNSIVGFGNVNESFDMTKTVNNLYMKLWRDPSGGVHFKMGTSYC